MKNKERIQELQNRLEKLEKIVLESLNREAKELQEELKPKFKVGDFITNNHLHLGLITEIKDNQYRFHGFNILGEYTEDSRFYVGISREHKYVRPTKDQIEEHLKKVADLKGYKEGVKVVCIIRNDRRKISGSLSYMNGRLYAYANGCRDGLNIYDLKTNKWAEIIEEVKPKYKIEEHCGDFCIYFNGSYIGEFENDKIAQKVCDLLNKNE